MASTGVNGNIVIWDVDYEKHIKSFNIVGTHLSTCQGISWNRSNTNLLLSCYQDGTIVLRVTKVIVNNQQDRRSSHIINQWFIPSGSHGISSIEFDPFHDSLFSCIHEGTSVLVHIHSLFNL